MCFKFSGETAKHKEHHLYQKLMNYPKYNGSCATMTLNQDVYIVVFGAANGNSPYNPTVEILNTVSPHNGWEMGMYYKGPNYLLLSISKDS